MVSVEVLDGSGLGVIVDELFLRRLLLAGKWRCVALEQEVRGDTVTPMFSSASLPTSYVPY